MIKLVACPSCDSKCEKVKASHFFDIERKYKCTSCSKNFKVSSKSFLSVVPIAVCAYLASIFPSYAFALGLIGAASLNYANSLFPLVEYK